MPGYVIHIAIAQEYLKKHNKKYSKEFIEGTIAPDMTKIKSETHYGKSPAYTNLGNFLANNTIDTEFMQGFFLHLIADYLFYNKYLDKLDKEILHEDYDYINLDLIDKYKVELPEKVKDKVFFKDGIPKILNKELAYKVIDEVSVLDMAQVEKEVKENDSKWNEYKRLI